MNAQDQQLKWFAILFAGTLLPVLGAIVGAFIGYLLFAQQAPRYKATAVLQNVWAPSAISTNGRPRIDDVLAIKSSAVLKSAVELGQLTQNRKLVGKSADQIIDMLKDPRTGLMTARLVSDDVNSSTFEISVTTEDAELSGDIVQAIVASYVNYIDQESNAKANYPIQSAVRLEVPTIGGFAGPYWPTYLIPSALICLATVVAIELVLGIAILKLKPATAIG